MVRRCLTWLALSAIFAAGCGSDSSSSAGKPAGQSAAAGHVVWGITASVPWLVGLDARSLEEVSAVQVADGATRVLAFDVAEGSAWIGRNDGFVVGVDLATESIVAEVDLTGFSSSGQAVQAATVAIGNDFVYSEAMGEAGPPVVAIDRSTHAATSNPELLDPLSWITSMHQDGAALWVATSSSVCLVKADLQTLESLGVAMVEGGDTELGGSCYMAEVGSAVWVFETDARRLYRVDKDSLEATVTDDLSDLTDFEAYFEVHANPTSVFLMLTEEQVIHRFDGASGARLHTYDFAPYGGIRTMAAAGDALYVITNEPGKKELLEVDIETGETTRSIEATSWTDAIVVQEEQGP